MNTKEPYITPRFHIKVPMEPKTVGYCLYRLSVGSKYFIQKGKSLVQSAENIATIIERGVRLKNIPDTDPYFKLVNYIGKNRVTKAEVDVWADSANLTQLEILKYEQGKLDEAQNDTDCLNNGFDAYLPKWIDEGEAQKFLQWRGISREEMARKREGRKKILGDLFDIVYYNAADRKKRGVYKLFFGEKYYIGRGKALWNRIYIHKCDIKKRLAGLKETTDLDYMRNVIAHVKETGLKVATCFLIKECVTVDDLVNEEQKAFDLAKNDPNCLNVGFVAKRIHNEIDDTPDTAKPKILAKKGLDGKKKFFYSKKK